MTRVGSWPGAPGTATSGAALPGTGAGGTGTPAAGAAAACTGAAATGSPGPPASSPIRFCAVGRAEGRHSRSGEWRARGAKTVLAAEQRAPQARPRLRRPLREGGCRRPCCNATLEGRAAAPAHLLHRQHRGVGGQQRLGRGRGGRGGGRRGRRARRGRGARRLLLVHARHHLLLVLGVEQRRRLQHPGDAADHGQGPGGLSLRAGGGAGGGVAPACSSAAVPGPAGGAQTLRPPTPPSHPPGPPARPLFRRSWPLHGRPARGYWQGHFGTGWLCRRWSRSPGLYSPLPWRRCLGAFDHADKLLLPVLGSSGCYSKANSSASLHLLHIGLICKERTQNKLGRGAVHGWSLGRPTCCATETARAAAPAGSSWAAHVCMFASGAPVWKGHGHWTAACCRWLQASVRTAPVGGLFAASATWSRCWRNG